MCRLTVRIDDHTDTTSYYKIWRAAAVANEMCGRRGQRAAVINLGMSAELVRLVSQFNGGF